MLLRLLPLPLSPHLCQREGGTRWGGGNVPAKEDAQRLGGAAAAGGGGFDEWKRSEQPAHKGVCEKEGGGGRIETEKKGGGIANCQNELETTKVLWRKSVSGGVVLSKNVLLRKAVMSGKPPLEN